MDVGGTDAHCRTGLIADLVEEVYDFCLDDAFTEELGFAIHAACRQHGPLDAKALREELKNIARLVAFV